MIGKKIPRKASPKVPKKEKNGKLKIENKFIIMALIGAVLAGVLIVLQTRFSEYMRMDNSGFAVETGTVTNWLSRSPEDEEIEKKVSPYSFDALEYLFSQGERLFFGERHKVQIDGEYPVWLNHGSSVQMINDKAVLLDQDFEEVSTYKGMMINDGITYNRDGEQADAAEYRFLKLTNGNFMNLKSITYTQKGKEKDIEANSLVHFETDYFSYYEIDNDTLIYKSYIAVPSDLIMTIDGESYTYEELLKALGIGKPQKQVTEKPEEEETEEAEPVVEGEELPETEEADILVEENDGEEDSGSTPTRPNTNDNDDEDQESPGVRPDSMRPDRVPDGGGDDNRQPEQGYVKPTVEVGTFEAGVYRLWGDITVSDPAKRIDPTKQVQFEVYEVDDKGKETLVLRSYRKSSGTVELGGGSIKPSSTYHIVYYFTYYNEYNESVVEQLGEQTVATKGIDTLNAITLNHHPGTSYHNRIEIAGLSYADGSDTEAVYGIDRAAGMTITVTPANGVGAGTTRKLTSSEISKFKRQAAIDVSTMSVLAAKTTYHYKITAMDYFGNPLTLINDTGTATTSNHAPEAKFSVVKNEIDDLELSLSVTDVDDAVVPAEGSSDTCNIYYVISEERKPFTSPEELSGAVYSYQLTQSEYSYTAQGGLRIHEQALPVVKGLELDTRYYATIYCDYDLDNGVGPQRFQNIGQFSFTSAGLNSLGRVYLSCTVSDVTSSSAVITYKLNTKSTNPELVKLITRLNADLIEGTGDDAEKTDLKIFNKDSQITDKDGKVHILHQDFREGEPVGYKAAGLTSMTEYSLNPHIFAEYNGKEYELIPNISETTFKTLRKPAEVNVENLLFAAGTLVFDVRVDDPDNAITGNSGKKVVVNLYTSDGIFVKATRILKNEDLEVTFKNLDVTKNYQLRFVAVEYNEGYTNATYESNKILKTVDINDAMRLSGSLKLQNIIPVSGDDAHYTANTKAVLEDPDHYLTGEGAIPYYIREEKDGELLKTYTYNIGSESSDGNYAIPLAYQVDKGEYSYKYTLYVIVSGREMVLDTLEFTTETTVAGFGTAYEMINEIKSNPDGKFVATADIVLSSQDENYELMNQDGTPDINSNHLSGTIITDTFGGNADFQGFTLEHHFYGDNQRMFTNLGPGSQFKNLVYEIYQENTTRVYDDACLCYRNFGTIRDIMVYYKGGYTLNNQIMALLARVNASTGVIDGFVIKNDPQEGYDGVSGYQNIGLAAVDNYGIVRNGYVYGSEGNEYIIGTESENGMDRKVAGIVANNGTVGKIYNVYSLLNVDVPERGTVDKKGNWNYASVCGYSGGNVKNMYSIGVNNPQVENKSPVVYGVVGKRYSKVYYWNDQNKTYTNPQSKLTSLESLYDVGWQRSVLGSRFDVSTVEVGYYPHVELSSDLMDQEYLPLPKRVRAGEVEMSQAEVQEYFTMENGVDAATVRFVFSNRQNLDITGLKIEDLTVKLDTESAESEDGYTTMYGTISDPQSFKSEYLIESVTYVQNGTTKTYNFNPSYPLAADFYRKVSNADEWYEYVVKPNTAKAVSENIRLMADINFDGIARERIMLPNTFTAKLDGNGKTISNINLQKGFKPGKNGISNNLFNDSRALESGGEVSHLYVVNYKCGGIQEKNGVNYVAVYGGLFRSVCGIVNDVHIRGIDAEAYDRLGAVAATVSEGGEVTNCTVAASDTMGVELTYTEPDNVNSDIALGGMIGWADSARVSHCFVRDAVINADEMRGSNGVGGVIGYARESVIDTAYAEGNITTRASKVGGIVGQYYSSAPSVACVKNVYAKVDIICHTDMVGGLIGQANVTTNIISSTNNMSGIAIGNVYASNTDSLNVSHTVGGNMGKAIAYYGTTLQLINGVAGTTLNENDTEVRGLLSYEQLTQDAYNTYRKTIGFENVYSLEGTQEGYLPKMYYEESRTLLPGQEEGIKLDETDEYDIDVREVTLNDANSRVVVITLGNPKGYTITGIEIDKLEWNFAKLNAAGDKWEPGTITDAVDKDEANGITRIYLQYKEEKDQQHFLDSYVLKSISFDPGNGTEQKLPVYARIGATLYKDIPNVDAWNAIPKRDPYENYRLTGNLDFSNYPGFAKNLKLGRLAGMGDKTISHADIGGTGQNLISRLNSGMDHIILKDSNVATSGSDCVGFIGISSGRITNCTFKDLSILQKSNNLGNVGVIGFQNGNLMENVTCENITVNEGRNYTNNNDNVGALCGNIKDVSTQRNITGKNLTVNGRNNIGGLYGAVYKADVADVALTDIQVKGHDSIGGMAGMLGGDDNANSGKIDRISITGTPERTDDGVITGSSTRIVGHGKIGGLIGLARETIGAGAQSAVDGITVTGCMVEMTEWNSSHVGGACGFTRMGGSYVTVKDSLVRAKGKQNGNEGVGGVFGKSDMGGCNYLTAENVRVESTDMRRVGGVVGVAWTSPIKNSVCRDSVIKAGISATTNGLVGGLVGQSLSAHVWYSGTINTIVDAETMSSVGGVLGALSENLAGGPRADGVYCLADTVSDTAGGSNTADGSNTTAAIAKYYVKGANRVGGISGHQYGGYTVHSYSNINVVAENGCAGGLTGRYNNSYTVGANLKKTYAASRLYNNYFAGTVTAENGYAGGAIGVTGLYEDYQVPSRSKDNKTGNINESDATYSNMILAASVKGKNAGAFAGDTLELVGRDNRLWDGIPVQVGNGGAVTLDKMTSDGGSYTYNYWKKTLTNGSYDMNWPQNTKALVLFSSKDLESDISNLTANGTLNYPLNKQSPVLFYRHMKWGLDYYNEKATTLNRTYTWRLSIKAMKNAYEKSGKDEGNYLPQARNTISGVYESDYSIQQQSSIDTGSNNGRLPIPQFTPTARPVSAALYSTERSVTTYGEIYGADADTVNVEFSSDLVGNGYYILKSGNTVVAKEKITQRVYSFDYGYADKLTFTWGFFNDTSLEGDELWKEENLIEMDKRTAGHDELARNIMVYGNDYYYISEEGVVSGSGTHSGDYLMLMNGKALDTDGNIWNVENWSKAGSVGKTAKQEQPKALFTFTYGSSTIQTYGKCSFIGTGENGIYREAQIFVAGGSMYTVPGEIENQKDGILLYTLNGTGYQTILGTDGLMVDMMQEDANLPEKVQNKAIIQITNTLNASVPYVIVEYSNGGMIGYNYATGEILFDNSIASNMSLPDYARQYFEGVEESIYHGISNTYSPNADLSQRIHSSADLDQIVGNNSGDLINNHSTGENTAEADTDNTALADSQHSALTDADKIGADGQAPGVGAGGEAEAGSETEAGSGVEGESKADGGAESDGEAEGEGGSKADGEAEDEGGSKADGEAEAGTGAGGGAEAGNGTGAGGGAETGSGTTVASGAGTQDSGKFMTIYNSETGMYEIVSVDKYLTDESYVSENARLGISNLPKSSGYAVAKVDKTQEGGILIYVIAVTLIVLLTGGVIVYTRRKRKL